MNNYKTLNQEELVDITGGNKWGNKWNNALSGAAAGLGACKWLAEGIGPWGLAACAAVGAGIGYMG
ncbi:MULTISPECIES: Blp family class II bacteriocin [unclassified Lactobacillus]|uniref:Blp family class II bacteriocin n=1 Tax=unclassified Lactobacillus TaxID=2620435 RepID=UPI000EFC7D46|nr:MULTISPECIES: Blp family class II bacteriocin [unclassified Lactobacillus]RMC46478.1 bacteriocin [Lactobacillus sp. ESL0230]RMC50780.1 bacteriocin [Lactobacillus sp. ESL0225]